MRNHVTFYHSIFLLTLAIVESPARGENVIAGHDLFLTEPGTSISFLSNPIPADFFAPGSEPFSGNVLLQGVRLESYDGVATGDMDTVVERMQDAILPEPFPSTDTIDIEVVALSLESVEPITVIVNGRGQPWDMHVGLSKTAQSTGSMTITHQNATGGVFDTTFQIQAFLTFTRRCDGELKTLDLGATGPSFTLSATGVPWQHTPSPVNPAFPPLTTNLFVSGTIEHDASGAAHHVVASVDDFLPPGEAFYVHTDDDLYRVSAFSEQLIIHHQDFGGGFGMGWAFDFAPDGTLYTTYYQSLWRVNMATGETALVCTLPFGWGNGLRVSPLTGELYIFGRHGPGWGFYRMTTDCQILESCRWQHYNFGMDFNPSGELLVFGEWTIAGGSGIRTVDTSMDPCGTVMITPYDVGKPTAISSDNRAYVLWGGTISRFCWVDGCQFPDPVFALSAGADGIAIGPQFERVFPDMDHDGIADAEDNCPTVPNPCQLDTDEDGAADACDNCPDVVNALQEDADNDGIGDACDVDCNQNNIPDDEDILSQSSADCNTNALPDECEIDLNSTAPGGPFFCNINCDPDCNTNGVPDLCDFAVGPSADCNMNGVLDACEITNQQLNQWASSVIAFSSQYSTGSWSAAQALGEPNSFGYGDFGSSWAPGPRNGTLEFLTLGYNTPVYANGVIVRETWGNGFAYQIDVIDAADGLHVVWADTDPSLPGTAVDFQLVWPAPLFLVKGVKIYVDTNHDLSAWEEIDAVRLLGNVFSGRDCNANGILDECDIRDCAGNPTCDDCNANSIPDGCDIASGSSLDADANNIPDECVQTNEIVWEPTTNPTPWPNINPLATTRSLRFTVTGPPGPAKLDAIKVTMIDLQSPNPPNLPANPPPNFSGYEAATCAPFKCGGGTRNGLTCVVVADCPRSCVGGANAGAPCPTGNECTGGGTCPATTCTAAVEANGCARWVGKPGTFREAQDLPAVGTYSASRLQCTPYYTDWKSVGLITAVGGEIAPSSQYNVQTYSAACMGVEPTCTAVSAPVTIYTRRSGDVEAGFCPPTCGGGTGGQPDVTDVTQLVNKFKNVAGALPKAISQLNPNLPESNADINVLDIVAVVDAFKQIAYAFSGPCACPSLSVCNATPCTSTTVCVGLPLASGGGIGSTCVKTCVGGRNDGDPCINDTHDHCPGGTCGPTAFCRDRCGRCN